MLIQEGLLDGSNGLSELKAGIDGWKFAHGVDSKLVPLLIWCQAPYTVTDSDASQNWMSEPLGRRLSRRVLTVPALAVASSMGLVIAVVFLPLALLVDLFTGIRARRLTRILGLIILLALVHLIYLPAVIVAGPIAWSFPTFGLHLDRWLQRTWASVLLRGPCAMLGLPLHEGDGDLPDPAKPVLVFSRHVSVLDVLIPMVYVAAHGHPRMRYVLKSALKNNALIDLVGQRLPNAFIDRSQSETSRAAVRRLGEGLGPAGGVVIYPEGTRATAARKEKALARLKSANLDAEWQRAKALRHLLPPRPAGVLELLDKSEDAQVCFLAHVGMDRFTGLSDLLAVPRRGEAIKVYRWVVAREEIPLDREARIEWLWRAWERMDEWIETHRLKPRDEMADQGIA